MRDLSNETRDNDKQQDSQQSSLSAKITRNIRVYVQSVRPENNQNNQVYAINWFNTRMLWLYNFYNFLGSVAVKKVGGVAKFKGKVKKILLGSQKEHRDVLLIVNYPHPENFVRMLESRYFQLVSLLRLISVTKFTFAFSQLSDKVAQTIESKQLPSAQSYCIHHFKSTANLTEDFVKQAKKNSVGCYFSAQVSSLIYSGDASGPKEQVPCIMQYAIVFHAKTEKSFTKMLNSVEYQSLIKKTTTSYVATMERLL